MTRSLPSSELQLTRVQVRAMVACPVCGAGKFLPCRGVSATVEARVSPRAPARLTCHQARIEAARSLTRARRLGATE